MNIKEELDSFVKTLSPFPIIVEGKKDKWALEEIGFTNIILLDKPLYQVVESVNSKEVIILTDFDKKGKERYTTLKQEFSRRGVKVNTKLRSFFRKNTPIVHIEGLATYFKNKGVSWSL